MCGEEMVYGWNDRDDDLRIVEVFRAVPLAVAWGRGEGARATGVTIQIFLGGDTAMNLDTIFHKKIHKCFKIKSLKVPELQKSNIFTGVYKTLSSPG